MGHTSSILHNWRSVIVVEDVVSEGKFCSRFAKIEEVLPNCESFMNPKVEIYTWRRCPFCIRAKALLDRHGIEYTEYVIDGDEDARDRMSERANGRRSVPQIFINDRHIGGCDDIYDLEARGELDPLLQTA
jgi:glutaredoxin 3